MALQFRRQIIVNIAGLEIIEPRIDFSITKTADATENRGEMEIYNLSREKYQQIHDRGTDVNISAGYLEASGPARIYEGKVQRVWKTRKDVAFITKVSLGDFLRSKEVKGGIIEQSYKGDKPTREIAVDIIKAMGLNAGPLDAIPQDSTRTNFSASGKPADVMNELIDAEDEIGWMVDDGEVRFFRNADPQPDRTRVIVSNSTGLVGTPETDEEGRVTIVTLLDSRLQVGGEIAVVDSEYIDDAPHTIVKVTHDGTNWTGRFITTVECVPIDKKQE